MCSLYINAKNPSNRWVLGIGDGWGGIKEMINTRECATSDVTRGEYRMRRIVFQLIHPLVDSFCLIVLYIYIDISDGDDSQLSTWFVCRIHGAIRSPSHYATRANGFLNVYLARDYLITGWFYRYFRLYRLIGTSWSLGIHQQKKCTVTPCSWLMQLV